MNRVMLAGCVLLLTCLATRVVAAQPPNVIIILADDLGWSDTTLYGTTVLYQTPNVERLARRGMTFSRAYSASPLCSPTRSAMLTGLSPARTGITSPNCHLPQVVLEATVAGGAAAGKKSVSPTSVTRLKTDYPTLSKSLKEAGYATGHFGKWHLGPEPYSPLEQGFEIDLPHHPGPGPAGSFVAPWKFANFNENSPSEHIEDRMAVEAVAWMEQQKDKPFFLNYWMFSVHAPFDAKKANIDRHRSRIDPHDAQRSPTYAAMIQSMDDAVGTLLDTIDRLGIADNTIIIFTSDNGGNMYNEVDGTTPTSNRPLRGGKATMFEGGTRVPCVVVWPGMVQPGSRSEAIIQSEDFYPTLLEGLALKYDSQQRFDGASILPALKGDPLAGKAVFQFFPRQPGVPDWLPPSVSVHRDDWKLIRLFHEGDEGAHRHLLFNLRDDLGEQHNLASTMPEVVKELDALLERFLAETGAVVPVPNPAFDPAFYRPELEGVPSGRKSAQAAAPVRAAVAGWQASKHAALTAKYGRLHLASSGGDPWISTTNLPNDAEGPFTVSLRLSSTASGKGQVFFTTPQNKRFSKEQSVPLSINHDGAMHDYEIALPDGIETLAALRLDPATSPGEIVIERFALRDASGHQHALNLAPPTKP